MNHTLNCQTSYDAVIVGGGHNGLAAAAYLARAGQSVLLLERNATLGGATASDVIFPGVSARVSRYSYLISMLPRKIVDDLGLRFVTRRRQIASCTPYVRDARAETLTLSNIDENSSRSSFERRSTGSEWRSYRKLLALQSAFAGLVWPSLVQPLRSRAEWTAALHSDIEREAWDAFVERPLGQTLETYLDDDLIRGLVFTDAKIGVSTYPDDPSLLQNRCFLYHVVGQGTGEWRVPVGGMGSLVSELARSAREGGAELVTHAEVNSVQPGPRNAVEFQIAGESRTRTVAANRVLINAGPQVFDRLLGLRHLDHPGDEGSVCKVNLLLTRLPKLKAKISPTVAFCGTFHVDEGYQQLKQSYQASADDRLPDQPPFETYCHSLTDDSILGARERAAGYQTLTMFGLDLPYRLFEANNDGTKGEVLRRYFDRLNQHLDEPIEECLAVDRDGNQCVEIKSPIDLEADLALYRGNIFHGELSWFFKDDNADNGRWGVETAIPHVYRCGSSATRGGAVSGLPGFYTARAIFDELKIAYA